MNPNDEKILKRIKELTELINYHNNLYYNYQSPEIEDYEYDMLFNELKELESKYPQFIQPNSPTQKLTSQSGLEIFKKSKHLFEMLSLDNTYNENDLIEFEKRIKNLINYNDDIQYIVELKFDGVSIELIYQDGKLQKGITRGDGIFGEDVTQNIKTIKSIPHKIDCKNELSVKGEIVMLKSVFLKLNNYLDEIGQPTFANTRNAASGSIRQKDPKITASRDLQMFVHSINSNEIQFKTYLESINFAKTLGFNIFDKIKVCNNIYEVIQYTKEIEKIKSDFEFEIDGLVIKVNDISLQQRLGQTQHHPRWAIAYKFKAETKLTKLIDVQYTVGRTGNIGIVGILEPVNLGGVKISRVSLHNFDLIKKKDIKINDIVEIKRAGEVIPEIIQSIKSKRPNDAKEILPPQKCPSCGHKIIKLDETQTAYYCINANCPAQIIEKLIHFASKDAMNIVGLGQNIIQLFYDKGFIKQISDIYLLHNHRQEILNLEGFKDKKIDNILNSIEKSKQNDLYRLIYGLGIRYIGEKTAKILAKNFQNMDNLYKASIQDFLAIDEIGEKGAYSLYQYLQENKPLIDTLKSFGLNMSSNLHMQNSGILQGKTFLFTGELSSMGRREAKMAVEKNGGTILSSVSKNLDFLVVGKNPGSKLKKAQQLNIKILNEEQFFDILKNGFNNDKT